MNQSIISSRESRQALDTDTLLQGDLIEPFFSFSKALELFYTNTWHRRCIRIKAHLLSQVGETTLGRYLPPRVNAKSFLAKMITELEIYGNGFIEKAGPPESWWGHWLPAVEARVDKDNNIHQYKNGTDTPLDGFHLKYDSPASRHYGEPDYMATVRTLETEGMIDEYNQTFFNNAATPNMAIVFENSDPSEKQVEAFRQFFATNFKGMQNSHRTLILSTGNAQGEQNSRIRFEPLNQVNDLSFEAFKRLDREEIIASHGVPPRLVGLVTAGQLGGGGELIGQLHQFNELEIKPKIELIEWSFREMGIHLDLKPIDTTNFKDDADVIDGLVQLGIISISEAREILGWQKAGFDGGTNGPESV